MSSNMQVNPIQLQGFQVYLENNTIRSEPIHNINELNELVRIYGRQIIIQVTFYFHDNQNKIHYLNIRNTGFDDKFVIEFFHYYNSYLEKIELTREEKIRDFTMVMHCINNCTHLNRLLVPHIVNPINQYVMMS